jgi:hypothetical protein
MCTEQLDVLTSTHWFWSGLPSSTRHTGTVVLHPQSVPLAVEFRHCGQGQGGVVSWVGRRSRVIQLKRRRRAAQGLCAGDVIGQLCRNAA